MEKSKALLPSKSGAASSPLTSKDVPPSDGLEVFQYLPDELIPQILSCLSVKILTRFKCVSKPWCSLIESRQFAKMHLKRSIENKTNIGMIIRGDTFHSVDFYSLEKATGTAIEINDEPMQALLYGASIVGACDGVLCLFNTISDIMLWNPSIRKCHKLPGPPIAAPRAFSMIRTPLCGFGFDHLHDDYKVVRIIPSYDQVLDSKVIVYSLKSNSWKKIENIPYELRFQGVWGMLVNGALHWIITKASNSHSSLIAFDLGRENYNELPLPNFQTKIEHVAVGVFGGCLEILAFYPRDRMDIFVMKEYGVANSWVKLFSVKQPKVIRRFQSLRPLAYSMNGKNVLMEVDNNSIMWFDIGRNKVKHVNIRALPKMFDVDVYTESLVQFNHVLKSNGEQQKQPKEKKQQQKKKDLDDYLSKGFKLVL